MRKVLIVSGCSFTTDDYKSMHHPEKDFPFDKWPKVLAKMLNMDYINLGQSGAGNEFIHNTIVDQIETMDKSKIGLVIPAWSQCRRRDYQVHYNRAGKAVWRHEMHDLFGDTKYWIKRSFSTYYFFQVYCEYYKVPYRQVQMIELFKDNDEVNNDYRYVEKNLKKLRVNKREEYDKFATSLLYYKKLKNFIGETSGILSLQDVLTDNRQNKEILKSFCISPEDWHPGEHGHYLIAKYIYENI